MDPVQEARHSTHMLPLLVLFELGTSRAIGVHRDLL